MHENRNLEQLESYLGIIREAPSDEGVVEMIVARPKTNTRKILKQAEIHQEQGLVGDNWQARGDKHSADGSADPGRQLTIMNSRVIDAITGSPERWPEAGDQLFVDFDLDEKNVPIGSHIAIGDAVVEVTPIPHLGCSKFSARFGRDATEFVNSVEGKTLKLRGINARVIKPGSVSQGSVVRKLGGVDSARQKG